MKVKSSPIVLSRELRKKLAEIEMAKILQDGNLLIICKSEEQRHKVIVYWEHLLKSHMWEKRTKLTGWVITRIPTHEDLEKPKWSMQGGEDK